NGTESPRSLPAARPERREGVGKRVLVIDDEEPILHMVRDALVTRGYQVDLAADGETALRSFRQTRYEVALCDWKMPGLGGQEVFEQIRAFNPAQADRIIFITGDVVSEKTRGFFDDGKRVYLPKPFTIADLVEAVRKVS